jgi:tetratricopeptide (TPR) repeat protein
VDSDEFRLAFDQLKKFPFVETISTPNELERYRFHNFVRDLLAHKLEEDKNLIGELHQVAQGYYNDKLKEHQDEHEEDSSYERLYRFEDKLWQGYVSEWLYHTSMLRDPQAFRQAEIRLATLYFETFQWWGWFLNSELCDRLLSQWEWTLQSKRAQHMEGEKLGILLRRFHESYPVNSPSFIKPPGAHWLKVRTALQPMLITLKLDRKGLDEDETHLRALILEYIAHSYLYFGGKRQDVEKAEQLYYEVRELHGDDWNISWMTSYLGEIYLRKGETDKALTTLVEATAMAEEDTISAQDNEIISRDFCLIGDCYWELGQYEQAFEAYNKAVFFAYAFLWHPDSPDPYNIKWYYAMRFRAAEQLIALHHEKNQPELARQFAQCLHDFWEMNWAYYPDADDLSGLEANLTERSIQGLMTSLFPQPPKPEELDESSSDEALSAATSEVLLTAQTMIADMYTDIASLGWNCGA